MGYAVCRLRSSFRDWLVNEYPIGWGRAADAIIYPTKGEAERIRLRIAGKTAVVDLGPARVPLGEKPN